MAARQGLRLERSRRRDPQARDFGRYALVDESSGSPVNPKLSARWRHSWTLDEVEEHLTEKE
jgi:hypothetical protein